MTKKIKIEGILAAMVTPFTKGGEFVDFDKVGPLANRLLSQGAHGLFPCGTTSEGMLMNPDERREVVEEVMRSVPKKTPVIPHTGGFDTATTIELTLHAQKCGAKAVAIVAPFFYGYDDEALFQYYKTVARAVDGFPILMYNIPACAKNVLHPQLVIRIAESEENVVGIKDSAGLMTGLTQMLGNAPQRIPCYQRYGRLWFPGPIGRLSRSSIRPFQRGMRDLCRRIQQRAQRQP